MVVVFTGTRVEDAKAIFTTSDLRILAVDNLEEAAKMVTSINCLFSAHISQRMALIRVKCSLKYITNVLNVFTFKSITRLENVIYSYLKAFFIFYFYVGSTFI